MLYLGCCLIWFKPCVVHQSSENHPEMSCNVSSGALNPTMPQCDFRFYLFLVLVFQLLFSFCFVLVLQYFLVLVLVLQVIYWF